MAKSKKTKPKPKMLNIGEIADMCDLKEKELRTGGAAFFTKLADTGKTKLIGPLVAASTASGANPKKFLSLLTILAEQFGDKDTDETEDAEKRQQTVSKAKKDDNRNLMKLIQSETALDHGSLSEKAATQLH